MLIFKSTKYRNALPDWAAFFFFDIALVLLRACLVLRRPLLLLPRLTSIVNAMTETTKLRSDCAHCAALCCVVFAFDQSSSFAINKPAGAPCPNLAESGKCNIHRDRARLGFSGCTVYDCLGAGQRVTQDIFGGRTWQDDRRLLAPMSRAFAAMCQIHRLLELLAAAEALPLDPDERLRLARLAGLLEPEEGWSEATLETAPITRIAAEVDHLMRSLKRHVSAD